MSSAIFKEVEAALKDSTVRLNRSQVQECVSLCNQFKLSGEDILAMVETYAVQNLIVQFQPEQFTAFVDYVRRKPQSSSTSSSSINHAAPFAPPFSINRTKSAPSSKSEPILSLDSFDITDDSIGMVDSPAIGRPHHIDLSSSDEKFNTPTITRTASRLDNYTLSNLKQSPPSGRYVQRGDAGKVVASLSVSGITTSAGLKLEPSSTISGSPLMPPETAAGEDAVRSAPTSTPEVTVLNLDVSRDIGKQVQGSAAIALNMIQNASSRGTEEAIGATCDTNPKEFRYMTWNNGDRAYTLLNHLDLVSGRIKASESFAAAKRRGFLSEHNTTNAVKTENEKKPQPMNDEQAEEEEEGDAFSPMNQPSAESILVTGRVSDEDYTTASSKLTIGSLVIDGGRRQPGRLRIRLGHPNLGALSLFPGQVIVCRGVNISGKSFVASSIFTEGAIDRVPPLFVWPSSCLTRLTSSLTSSVAPSDIAARLLRHDRSLRVLAAAGPFTPTDTISYCALDDLLGRCKSVKPDLLILMGPFVDADNPAIAASGSSLPGITKLDKTFEEHFADILQLISDELINAGCSNTRVVLVPSTRDAHHDPIFPQPKFRVSSSYPNITLAPNPCLFAVNGVTFGVSTHDILFELGRSELFVQRPNPAPLLTQTSNTSPASTTVKVKDEVAPLAPAPRQLDKRVVRLAQHLLSQQSFYPLFPYPIGSNVDPSLHPRFLDSTRLPFAPDFLIIPSKLRYFVESVPVPAFSKASSDESKSSSDNDIIFINPETITKGQSGGTYASMYVRSGAGPITSRASVDIIKV